MEKNHANCKFVISEDGQVMLQLCSDNQWGFDLITSDQTFSGGFGSGMDTWEHCSKSVAKRLLSSEEYGTLSCYL